MKKLFIAIAALCALVSCKSLIEEWQPVVTFGDNEPGAMKVWTEADLAKYGFTGKITPIQDMKAQYKKKTDSEKTRTTGHKITENVWIKGRVVSDDRTGNIYREIYLQDDSGAIDLKLGKSSLYSDFQFGQWVYVKCTDLCIGAYKGMPQLGLEPDNTSTNEYETSYIDIQAIIDTHVFRGPTDDTPVTPKEISVSDVRTALSAGTAAWNSGALWGTLVTVKGLEYGNQTFALVYPHGILPHKSENPENRVFISKPSNANYAVAGYDYTWGIKTWAMSKTKYKEYIEAGLFDDAVVASGSIRYGPITTRPADYASAATISAALTLDNAGKFTAAFDKQAYTPAVLSEKVLTAFGNDAKLTFKELMIKYATANYVSHYFKFSGTSTTIQVRTSGYAKFSDQLIPAAILGGSPVQITGILTYYDESAQISLITAPDDKDNPSVTFTPLPGTAN
jgi:hypothetical protein